MTTSRSARRPAFPARTVFVLLAALLVAAPHLRAQKLPIQITAYNIDAELKPQSHILTAVTRVTFTALEPMETAVFELHGALKVDKVTDAKNLPINGERGAEASLRITPQQPLSKGQTYTWTFYYSGALESDAGGPVEGLKLAYVGDPTSYLLYGGRWFPMVGYQTDRFTADIHVKVPTGYQVIGSGSQGQFQAGRERRKRVRLQLEEARLPWHDPSGQVQPAGLASAEYPRLYH